MPQNHVASIVLNAAPKNPLLVQKVLLGQRNRNFLTHLLCLMKLKLILQGLIFALPETQQCLINGNYLEIPKLKYHFTPETLHDYRVCKSI